MRRLALTLALIAAGCSYPTSKYTLRGADGAVTDVPTGTDVPIGTDGVVTPDIPVVTDVPIVTDVAPIDVVVSDGGMDAVVVPTDAGPGSDAELDVMVVPTDAEEDVLLADAGVDVQPIDTGVDVAPVDTGVDVPPVDTGVDVPVDMNCATGMAYCSGGCISTTSDPVNCGGCGTVCSFANATSICTTGVCGIGTCMAGFANCNGTLADGCETSLNDATNCGACGRACSSTTETCFHSACYATPTVTTTGYSNSTVPLGSLWIDACAAAGGMHVLPSVHDATAQVPLPFAFTYYGVAIAAGRLITVDSSGFLQMPNGAPSVASMTGLYYGQLAQPSPLSPVDAVTPSAIVAPWWVDLDTGPAGVCVAMVGSSFVVEWSGATYPENRAAVLNFEVVFTSVSNNIQFLYQNIVPPPSTPTEAISVTVGLGNATSNEGYAVCNEDGTTCPITSATAQNFTPVS